MEFLAAAISMEAVKSAMSGVSPVTVQQVE
jgi:hypothetical protein